MNVEYFKHAVLTIEGHFNRPFGTADTRSSLLNKVFAAVKHHDDGDLTLACESLMMHRSTLPTPAELQSSIEQEAGKRQRAITDSIERESARNNAEVLEWRNAGSVDKQMIQDGMRLHTMFASGGITRRELITGMLVLDKTYPKAGWRKAAEDTLQGFGKRDMDGYCLKTGIINGEAV